MTIPAPPRPEDHPDRFLDAQEAIELAFLALLENATAAGWGEREAIAAIIELAENRSIAIMENEEVEALLRRLVW